MRYSSAFTFERKAPQRPPTAAVNTTSKHTLPCLSSAMPLRGPHAKVVEGHIAVLVHEQAHDPVAVGGGGLELLLFVDVCV